MSYVGMDYGCGLTNVDHETGIRYGVIPASDLGESWYESAEADYGPATCGDCGGEAIDIVDVPFDLDDCEVLRKEDIRWGLRTVEILKVPDEHKDEIGEEWTDEGRDYACLHCARSFDSDEAWGDEPTYGFNVDDGEYQAHQGHDDCDVFVLKSPYYTRAAWCSPCAPGAAYLRSHNEDGPKAYCFGPDWYRCYRGDDNMTGEYDGEPTSCPHPVWRVDNDELVFMPKGMEDDE